MEQVYEKHLSTAVGSITVRCSDRGLREVLLNGAEARSSSGAVEANGQKTSGARWAHQAARELEEYFAGKRRNFDVPFDLDGTPFQKKVWKALCTIPYGETRSYGDIARQVKNPRGARAVGMANHHNPIAIIVPCHRVIASGGDLGGYGGGLKTKSYLLWHEQQSRPMKAAKK
jgi:methylated-DNA-[protein]-cysteine S-methyltransferase